MNREKLLSLIVVSAVVIGMLAACAPAPTAEVGEEVVEATVLVEEVATATPEPEESVLIIALPTDPVLLDPQMSTRWFDFTVYDNIYERLYYLDKDLNVVPQLATSYEKVDDLTWEFKLREGVKFTNGEPFNANTVKCTLEKILDPDEGTLMRTYFSIISEIEVVDDLTVRLHTAEVDPLMLPRLAGYGGTMIPCAYLDEVGREEFGIKPVGTGPYKIESWVKDAQLVFVRNDDYWGKPGPYERVIWKPIPEASARVASLIVGEVDLITALPPDQVETVEAAGKVVGYSPAAASTIWGMCYDNCETPILRDTTFRLALNLAIDRESIVRDLYRGMSTVPNGFINTTDFGYDPSLPPMEYDPDKARQLIEESGYQGETIAMYTTVSDYVPLDKALAETVSAMLKDVGVNVDLRVFDTAERSAMITAKTCPGMFLGNPSSPFFDPASHFWRQLRPGAYYDHGWSVTNQVFYDSMTAAESESDPEKRAELYRTANQAMLQDPPWLMVLQQGIVLGYGDKVADSTPRGDYRIMIEDFEPPH